MSTAHGVVVGAMLALGASAWAGPGELIARSAGEPEPLEILDVASAKACPRPGVPCWAAGARTTIAVESNAVAVGAAPGKKTALPVTPRFARAASLAGAEGAPVSGGTGGAWTVELSATLKRPAWAGNAVFMIFDADDREALAANQFTALYQSAVKAGPRIAARLTLSPEEGFRAGRTYKVRIVQLVNGKEILLAEGDVTLL